MSIKGVLVQEGIHTAGLSSYHTELEPQVFFLVTFSALKCSFVNVKIAELLY